MSNCSAPPRARISSTVRAPAMPLPTTTSRLLVRAVGRRAVDHVISLHQPEVDDDGAATARPARRRAARARCRRQVLDDPQRHVRGALGADREVPHRLPSRNSTTVIICSVVLPPRKYTGCVMAPAGRRSAARRRAGPACRARCPRTRRRPAGTRCCCRLSCAVLAFLIGGQRPRNIRPRASNVG